MNHLNVALVTRDKERRGALLLRQIFLSVVLEQALNNIQIAFAACYVPVEFQAFVFSFKCMCLVQAYVFSFKFTCRVGLSVT
jgi:hypothetical protein